MEPEGVKARSRTKIACEECRKNKRKCGGERPACSLCTKSGRTCVYPTESRKRKFSDDTLIKNLENQVKALESIVKAQQTADVPATEEYTPLSQYIATPGYQFPPAVHDNTSALREPETLPLEYDNDNVAVRSNLAMEELASLMLTVKLEDQGEPSFAISSGKPRFAPGLDPPEQYSRSLSLDTASSSDPIQSLQSNLLQNFMERFNVYHQVIDAAEWSSLRAVDLTSGNIDARFRNYALFAIAAYLSGEDLSYLSKEYAAVAEGIALQCIRERPTDLVVQGFSLLSWRELQLGNDSMAYNYTAMATGQILHQGLHVTSLIPVAQAAEVDQALYHRRVRSFWAYFSIDRVVTSSIGMNCTMHYQRVKPPSYLSITGLDCSVDDVAHDTFNQLWHLWDMVLNQVHAFGWGSLTGSERKTIAIRSHQQLKGFYEGIDSRLNLQKGHFCASAVWFQLNYQTAMLLVHRPLLNESPGSFTLDLALRSVTSAAASISRILRVHRKYSGFKHVMPEVIECVLSAAVIHLLNATSGRTTLGRQSANGLRTCLEVLQEMEPKWHVRVDRAISRLQQLAHRWKVIWALPLNLSQPLSMTAHDEVAPDQIVPKQIGVNHPNNLNMSMSGDFSGADIPVSYDPFWDRPNYQGALEQINTSTDMQNWNLDWLFENGGLQPGFDYGSFGQM